MIEERDPMIGIYVYETYQLIEQLENVILDSEKSENIGKAIHEIFRIMHTIKGNSMMMKYDNIAGLAHVSEDLFDYLRQNELQNLDYGRITDIVLEGVDFLKEELQKIEKDIPSSDQAEHLKETIVDLLNSFKFMNCQNEKEEDDLGAYFYIKLMFEEEAQMENVRAFGVVHNLNDFGCDIYQCPIDLDDAETSIKTIKRDGFQLAIQCKQTQEELEYYFDRVSFLQDLKLEPISKEEFKTYKTKFGYQTEAAPIEENEDITKNPEKENNKEEALPEKSAERNNSDLESKHTRQQKYINVDVDKLDMLMNLVGELVVSEAMVTQNPELKKLNIPSIEKAGSQMRKIINEVQDIVMEIRMMPLSVTFQRMNRIVRDMSIKVNKEVDLVLIGQETEVDKNIIEHIADPLMHLIRNSIDHGIETPEERQAKGKPSKGKIILEARNSGGDVWIVVRDDGKGLDRDSILAKAQEKGMLKKSADEYTDKEVYSMIFEPGFSTKSEVTSFSGRGVGMDAVIKEVEKIGGLVIVDSKRDEGTTITLRIPLTLAIINGLIMQVGNNKLTLPITSIRESFKAKEKDIIQDAEGHSMIMVRGECYSIIKLYEKYGFGTEVTDLEKGVFMMLENDDYKSCIFIDKIIGEGQLVVKSFSKYIKKIKGISGCAHLGDGGICLILDPSGMILN